METQVLKKSIQVPSEQSRNGEKINIEFQYFSSDVGVAGQKTNLGVLYLRARFFNPIINQNAEVGLYVKETIPENTIETLAQELVREQLSKEEFIDQYVFLKAEI